MLAWPNRLLALATLVQLFLKVYLHTRTIKWCRGTSRDTKRQQTGLFLI
jgi:hypothetical protein